MGRPKIHDVAVGQRVFRWTVIESPIHTAAMSRIAKCRCDCGKERYVSVPDLSRQRTHSCGCLATERSGRLRHGHARAGAHTSEFETWQGIKKRCHNPNAAFYQRYGGRGIRVCDRWFGSFENFMADMGPKPSNQHSIERRDNNANYSPDNCYWADRFQQGNNKRNNILLTHNGRTQTVAQWARELGVNYHFLWHRIRSGWSHERALTSQLEPSVPSM